MRNKLTEIIREVSISGKDYEQYVEDIVEKLIAEGVILPPCRFGQTVYAALVPYFEADPENGEVDEWRVKGIAYENDGKWWIESEDDEWYELGENLCKLTKEEAKKALAELADG